MLRTYLNAIGANAQLRFRYETGIFACRDLDGTIQTIQRHMKSVRDAVNFLTQNMNLYRLEFNVVSADIVACNHNFVERFETVFDTFSQAIQCSYNPRTIEPVHLPENLAVFANTIGQINADIRNHLIRMNEERLQQPPAAQPNRSRQNIQVPQAPSIVMNGAHGEENNEQRAQSADQSNRNNRRVVQQPRARQPIVMNGGRYTGDHRGENTLLHIGERFSLQYLRQELNVDDRADAIHKVLTDHFRHTPYTKADQVIGDRRFSIIMQNICGLRSENISLYSNKFRYDVANATLRGIIRYRSDNNHIIPKPIRRVELGDIMYHPTFQIVYINNVPMRCQSTTYYAHLFVLAGIYKCHICEWANIILLPFFEFGDEIDNGQWILNCVHLNGHKLTCQYHTPAIN